MTRVGATLALVLLASCTSTCGDAEELAELAARLGNDVERDEASTPGKWHEAELRTRFSMGDGLRTGAQSSAELALLPSGAAQVAPHSVLRFMATPPRDPSRHVALEAGEVEVAAEQIDLEIHTPRAVTQVSRGSKVKLSMRDGHERFDLVVGRVVVAHAGLVRTLEPAHPLELNANNELVAVAALPVADEPAALDAAPPTIVEALPADASSATMKASGPALPDAGVASGPSGEKQANGPASSGSALRLRVIESATLHVSKAPVLVFLPIGDCGPGAELRVDGQVLLAGGPARFDPRELASDGSTVDLALGNHRIHLSCADNVQRAARLVVTRDPARLDLPKRAQSVRVEADGRRYTVRYQNLLPDLTFVWPGEPETGSFTLIVRSGKRELVRSLQRPEQVLSGTALGEGEHKFWFRSDDGRSSKPTTLRLAFDNTARSAYLSLPIEGSAVTDEAITVEGAALVASKVSVEGTPAKLDEQGRFHEQVQLAPEQKSVSVRVEHPGSGVHYYLRRLR